MRVAVVGGGLAGLSAALELVDGGHEVTLYETRPSSQSSRTSRMMLISCSATPSVAARSTSSEP